MTTKLLLAILLAGLTIQQCTIGCLKCNNLNQCLLCDVTNNYYVNGNTCTLSTQTNCNVLALNGACVLCNSNFYLDLNSQRCVAVANSSLAANCGQYNAAQLCISCTGSFFVAGGQCAAVNATIANCQMYSTANFCTSCASGYVTNADSSACVALPTTGNCMAYNYLGCARCNTGFIQNPNLYFVNMQSPSWVYTNVLMTLASPVNTWNNPAVCQQTIISNCLTFSTFSNCTNCRTGFFLQNGNCIAYPLPVIFSCMTYSTLVTCTACQAGYYLSSNTCIANSVIANCVTYSGAATTTTCVACNNGFYLQGNTCVNRTISSNIANCQTVAIAADICATCATGFILTSDGRACLAAITNCASYAASTFQSSSLQCSLCNNGFYLATGTNSVTICTAGTILNCLTYQVNANTCTACQNGYYLGPAGTCVQHIAISNCATYDPSKANHCANCNPGFYNFGYTSVCVQTTVINNCQTYNTDGNSCLTCASNYYVNAGTCTIIPTTFANCAVYSGTQCTLCNTGYMLNTLPTVGTCILPLDYIMATSNSPCAVSLPVTTGLVPTWVGSPSSTQGLMTCGTCNDYMYGYTPLQAEAICVNTNQLVLYSGFTTVTNCLRYGLNYATSPAVVCMQCASGWFISGYVLLAEKTTATTCVNTCAAESTVRASPAVIVDDMLGFVNICATFGTAGAIFVPDGFCSRYARVVLNTISTATGLVADYVCLAVHQTSGTYQKNIMVYSFTNAVLTTRQYVFESPSATTQQSVTTLVGAGYSNTVDSNSLFPNVFNYLGLLSGTHYAAAQIVYPLLGGTDPDVAAASVVGNNLNNCDIAALYTTAAYGDAAFRNAGLTASADNLYGCFRCQFGYQVSYVSSTAAGTIPSFPSCVQMTNCASTNTVYGGLTQFLNSILSCHVCSQSNGASLFPTVYYEFQAAVPSTGNWIGWAAKDIVVQNGGATAVTVAAGNGFKCSAALTLLQTTNTLAAAGTAVNNCAVFGFIQSVNVFPVTAAGDIGTGYNTCLACAANYWPTYAGAYSIAGNAGIMIAFNAATNNLPRYVVTACTASLNCDASVITQFNGCGKCRSDLENLASPSYYAFMDMTMSNCYQAASKFCLVLSTTSFSTTATNNACDICKAGYFMNTDSMCEQYRVPNESVSAPVFVNSYVASKAYILNVAQTFNAGDTDNKFTRAHYLLSHKQLQYGVSSCSSGYTLAPASPWAPRLCVWSSYVYNNTGTFSASSNFINNCVRYNLTQINSKNVCGGCTTGFIPTQDGTSCVSSSSVPNCFYAQNSPNQALCYQCITNFNNVNGVCSSTTIPNCATYLNTLWSFTSPSALTCATCINGFVLASDALSCSAGSVGNCIQYTQAKPLVCTVCATGYVLMTLNAVYYCYPIPASLNCAILQDTSPNSGANYGTISCSTCNANSLQVFGTRQWTALGLTTQAQTLCMPFTPIANCNAYDQSNAVIKSNTFGCTTCASGFWYSSSNYTCVPRSVNPAQCSTYNPTADLCTACNTGSFLSADGTNCVSFPNGIFQCRLYSAATTCTQCNAPYYLTNNACVLSTAVSNCATYTANFTCSACVSGYFLQNSTSCVTATATNCLTYTSLTTCSTCNTGFGLQTTNGVTNCVTVNLNNCVNATAIAPFTCVTCATGFYPNSNGVCTTVSQTIANCLTYDTATTCAVCSSNAVLSVARTSCNTTYFSGFTDPNCAQNTLMSTPTCSRCSFGSFFVNGACQTCSNNTYASGCLSCDPTNNNVCLACRPTFYMNSAGGCISNSPTPPPNNNNNTSTNATATLNKAVSVGLALAAIYFEWA